MVNANKEINLLVTGELVRHLGRNGFDGERVRHGGVMELRRIFVSVGGSDFCDVKIEGEEERTIVCSNTTR